MSPRRWLLMILLLGWTHAAAALTIDRAEPLTFAETMRRGLKHNAQLAVAGDEADRAAAVRSQVRAAALPTLIGNGTYTRLDKDRVFSDGTTTAVIAAADQVTLNATATLPLLAPRAWTAWRRAAHDIDTARLDALEAQRRTAGAIAHAYLAVLLRRRLLELDVHARDAARAHDEYTHSRQQLGAGSRIDALRAREELAHAEADIETAQLALARAQEDLGVLIGNDRPIDAADVPCFPDATAGLDSIDLARRPDVLAQTARLTAARVSAASGWAEWVPTLNGLFVASYNHPDTPFTPQLTWQAQLVLMVPIWDGGRRDGLGAERRIVADEEARRLADTRRAAEADARVARLGVARADRAAAQARVSADAAAEAVELASRGYRLGAGSNLELVDAQRRARDLATDAAIADADVQQARVDLLLATGRFP